MAALCIVVPMLARIIAAGSEFPGLFVPLPAVRRRMGAPRRRRDGWGESPLLYEDDEDLAPNLGIRELSFGQMGQAH